MLEDEPEFGDPIRAALADAGFARVELVTDGAAALARATGQAFDLLILDRLNAGLDGLEVLRRIRADGAAASSGARALVITALGADEHRLQGLIAGAEDYIPKPVEGREVVLRVAALFAAAARAGQAPATGDGGWIARGPLRIHPEALVLELDGRPLRLSRGLSFKIVLALMEAGGVPMSHAMLWDRCWTGWTFRPEAFVNVVDTRLSVLRAQIAQQMPEGLRAHDDVIAKVWLEGFVIRDLTGRLA